MQKCVQCTGGYRCHCAYSTGSLVAATCTSATIPHCAAMGPIEDAYRECRDASGIFSCNQVLIHQITVAYSDRIELGSLGKKFEVIMYHRVLPDGVLIRGKLPKFRGSPHPRPTGLIHIRVPVISHDNWYSVTTSRKL